MNWCLCCHKIWSNSRDIVYTEMVKMMMVMMMWWWWWWCDDDDDDVDEPFWWLQAPKFKFIIINVINDDVDASERKLLNL